MDHFLRCCRSPSLLFALSDASVLIDLLKQTYGSLMSRGTTTITDVRVTNSVIADVRTD